MNYEDLKKQIKSNNRKISGASYMAALEHASTISTTLGDLRLERIQAAIQVLLRHSYSDRLVEIGQKAQTLNLLRSMYSYKPCGFDQLVEEIETAFFFASVDHGMGERQLAALSYLFPIDVLETYGLVYLRNRD